MELNLSSDNNSLGFLFQSQIIRMEHTSFSYKINGTMNALAFQIILARVTLF
jgi:hypothetical protein